MREVIRFKPKWFFSDLGRKQNKFLKRIYFIPLYYDVCLNVQLISVISISFITINYINFIIHNLWARTLSTQNLEYNFSKNISSYVLVITSTIQELFIKYLHSIWSLEISLLIITWSNLSLTYFQKWITRNCVKTAHSFRNFYLTASHQLL